MKKFIYLIFYLVLFSRCELVVDVKMPETPVKLVVNSVFQPDSTWQVDVFRSSHVLEDVQRGFNPVDNAIVIITSDDGEITPLSLTSFGRYRAVENKKPVSGKIYSIEVSAQGFEPVQSQGKVPMPTRITRAVFEERTPGASDNFNNFIIDLTFDDDPATENYYEVELYKHVKFAQPGTIDTISFVTKIYIQRDEATFTDEYTDRVLINDSKKQRGEISVRVSGFDSFNHSDESEYILSVISLSKDLQDYILTSTLQRQTSGDPFAQPVHVANNIENGYGIFGGANSTSLRFKR